MKEELIIYVAAQWASKLINEYPYAKEFTVKELERDFARIMKDPSGYLKIWREDNPITKEQVKVVDKIFIR